MRRGRDEKVNKQGIIIFGLLFLVVGTCFFSPRFVVAQTNQTESEIQSANMAVNQAFTSVLTAEKSGANVTNLLFQLNVAEADLAQAENFYRSGDSSAATARADFILQMVQQVTTAAQSAKQTATVSSQNAFWSTIAFTVIGAFVFVLAMFVFWRRFKQRYINNLSQAKPEANIQ